MMYSKGTRAIKICIILLPILFMGCWPLSITKTLDCYMDVDSCAYMYMIEHNWNSYKIISQDENKNKVKIRFNNKGR